MTTNLDREPSQMTLNEQKKASQNFVLSRDLHPQFYVGMKSNGQPIFSQEEEFARHYTETEPELAAAVQHLKEKAIDVHPTHTTANF